jgi:hypothetical protein
MNCLYAIVKNRQGFIRVKRIIIIVVEIKIAVSLFHAVLVVKYAVLDYHKVLVTQAVFIGIATIAVTLSG